MYLLKKNDFEFSSIKESGYEISEQPNVIAKKQFANGKRKKIVTSYTDVVINVTIGGLTEEDMAMYLAMFQDGAYEYYSVNDESYKTANFIVTVPSVKLKKVANETDYFYHDLNILLEKSSDYEEESESI